MKYTVVVLLLLVCALFATVHASDSDEEMPYYSAASALAASTDLQRSVLMNKRNSEVAERQRELLVQRAQKNAADLRAMQRSVSMNQRNSAVSERQREMLVQRVQKNRALIRAMNRTMQFYKHKSDQSDALLSRLAGGAELEVVPQPETGMFVFNLLESDVKLDEEQTESDMDMSLEDQDSTFGVQVEGPSCDFLMGKSGYKANANDLCTCRDDGPFASNLVCMKAVSFPGFEASSIELDMHFAPCSTKPLSFAAKAMGFSTPKLEFGTEASISFPIPHASIPLVGGLEVVGKLSVNAKNGKFALGLGVNLCAGFEPLKGCKSAVDIVKLDFPFKCKL